MDEGLGGRDKEAETAQPVRRFNLQTLRKHILWARHYPGMGMGSMEEVAFELHLVDGCMWKCQFSVATFEGVWATTGRLKKKREREMRQMG